MFTMYRKHVGGLGTWRVWHEGPIIRIAHATVEGGQEVVHEELVQINQSGRSLAEQIDLRIRSRISRQRDRGYTENRDEALKGNTNQMGLPLPMLAQPIKKVKSINYEDAVLQLKLNGHRCLSTRQDGKILMYSRQGKPINLPHIAEHLDAVLPEGVFLDGELYHHGTPLQTIGSWIKKQQPESINLSYFSYDLVSKDTYRDRHKELQEILGQRRLGPVKPLDIIPYAGEELKVRAFRTARGLGYEGLILRTNDSPYQDGVRSSSLLKIKEFLDCEVTVKDVIKVEKSGTVICICLTDDGKEVRPVAPGNQQEKALVYDQKASFIGRRLTIDYAELTEDGVPAQPVAREWREDL